MQRKLTNQDVDLARLTDALGEFFAKHDFEAVKGETDKGYQIFASDSPHFKVDGYISVTVEGNKNDFTVNFELCRESGSKGVSPIPSIFLTTMLGGGYFMLKRLKANEAFIKLENTFWAYVENTLLSLEGSADESSQH
jgi:hypothetical protein